jgi:hypothetical protein
MLRFFSCPLVPRSGERVRERGQLATQNEKLASWARLIPSSNKRRKRTNHLSPSPRSGERGARDVVRSAGFFCSQGEKSKRFRQERWIFLLAGQGEQEVVENTSPLAPRSGERVRERGSSQLRMKS